jgi:hypothetical protein
MTLLQKSVNRLTKSVFPYRGPERRPVVVALAPGDLLVFRFRGTRKRFTYPIGAALRAAIEATARAEAALRRQRRRNAAASS